MTEAIGQRLQYFQELESATRMLNHPGESLVLQVDFLYMVERVDLCIEYFKHHVRIPPEAALVYSLHRPQKNFRESDLYLLRFQQCMTRAMTLIKMYFVGSVRALTADISRRLAEKDVSATAQNHLLYTRFTSVSSQLSPLLSEFERRAQTHPDELSALLAECHAAYFAARKSLLVNRLINEIKGLDPTRTELVELVSVPSGRCTLRSRSGLTIPRPGQAVATSNNFASTNLSYSAHSSIPGKPCYSRFSPLTRFMELTGKP